MLYQVIKSEPTLWTVGFHDPSDNFWIPESDHDSNSNALQRAAWLNGDTAEFCYIRTEPGLYTVGKYDSKGKWHPLSDHNDRESAANSVNQLNNN